MSSLMAVTLAVTGLLWSLAFAQAQVNFYKGAWDWNWFCQNDGDCNNLGQCDLITGRCACHVTYFGQRCQNKRCPLSSTNGKICGGHGACIQSHKKQKTLPNPLTKAGEQLIHGHCACEAGWSGPACDQRACPDNCKAGSRREGTCVADTSKFSQLHHFDHNHLSTCQCFPGSYGTGCQYKRCPVSPRGFECDSPSGSEVSVGALYNANNHGTCNKLTGRCECTEGNYGAACEFRICPGQMYPHFLEAVGDRGAKGTLLTFDHGTNSYNKENYGADNYRTYEGGSTSSVCRNQGTCDPTLGVCNCFDGFHGPDCSLRHCPNSTRGFICDNAGTCDSDSGECICSNDVHTPNFQRVAAYGKDCSLRRCPQVNGYDCDREGECDASTGMCKCHPGRYGPDCSWRTCPRSKRISSGYQQVADANWLTTTVATTHADYGVECNDKGTCDRLTGQCECQHGWYGPDCALKYCPEHFGLVCNNEGSCDTGTGECKCNNGFHGESCQYRKCQKIESAGNQLECGGHGTCNTHTGICKCANGFYGPDCSRKTCPEHHGRACNFHGQCVHSDLNVGVVKGVTGHTFVGDGQALLTDPSGRGRYPGNTLHQELSGSAQGKCLCNPPYYGESCQFKMCPVSKGRELQCDGHGTCSPETGYCTCTAGYSGADCSIGTCPEWHNRICNNQGKCTKTNNLLNPANHKLITFDMDADRDQTPFTLKAGALNRGVQYDDTADIATNKGWGYCICNPTFYGRSCEKQRCPMSKSKNAECDGHGKCDTRVGICQCDHGYYGKDCSMKRCPEYNGRVCNLQGECQISDTLKVDMMLASTTVIRSDLGVPNAVVGTCKCKYPYFGESCELQRCPSAHGLGGMHQWSESTLYDVNSHAEISENVYRGHSVHRPTEECSNHGTCQYDTGLCSCNNGWYGASCERRECPQHDGRVCNLHGSCVSDSIAPSLRGTCKCIEPFYGDACQFKRCPASKARAVECDGHGSCNSHTGRCSCNDGYSGEFCESKECPVVAGHICNNQGTCVREDQADDNLGTCKCTFPYFGTDCSQKHCPASNSNSDSSWHGVHRSQECDGHGVCNYDTGRCNCDGGYGGLDCSNKKGLCPMSNKNRQLEWRVCNGEGTCNHQTGLCHCHSEEYSGLDCSYRRCPRYPEVNGEECNSHGECIQAFDDRGQWTGVCKCHSGWSGKYCHELYTTAAQASSRPPPSYFPPQQEAPHGAFITSERRHIILGSEGFYHPVQGEVSSYQGEAGSYQTPQTLERSTDYYAGQHPVNHNTCVLNVTGCQHSVTHPEVSTGQHSGVTQPLWQQNLDSVGNQNWRGGEGVSPLYTGAIFSSPHYSGVGGPAEQDYSPSFTSVSNDVGQIS